MQQNSHISDIKKEEKWLEVARVPTNMSESIFWFIMVTNL